MHQFVINSCTAIHCQKFAGGKIFECLWKKSLLLTRLHLFDQIYSKNRNILKYSLNIFENNLFLWCKLNLLQSTVSRDPSEIIVICWFAAKETLPIILNADKKTVVLLNIFVEPMILFRIIWWITKTAFEIEVFCKIINAFTVSFDQINASLLNESII